VRKGGALIPAVMLLLGVLVVQWWVTLPPSWSCGVGVAIALVLLRGGPYGRALAWCLFGIAWACWRGSTALDGPPCTVTIIGYDFAGS